MPMQYTFHLPEIQKDNGTKFELFTAQLSTGSVQLTSATQQQQTEANQVGWGNTLHYWEADINVTLRPHAETQDKKTRRKK